MTQSASCIEQYMRNIFAARMLHPDVHDDERREKWDHEHSARYQRKQDAHREEYKQHNSKSKTVYIQAK
jgi:hypothetical protein